MQHSSNKGGGCLMAAVVLIILIVVAALVVGAIAVWGGISIGDAMQVRDLKLDMKEAREEAFDEYLYNGTALQDSESGREYLRLRNELIERGEMKESDDASFLEMTGTTVDRAPVPSVDLENKPSQNDTLVLENDDQSTEDEEPDDKSFLENLFGKDDDAEEESGSASTGSHAQPGNAPAQKPEKDKNADKGDAGKLTDEQRETMMHIEAWLAETYSDTEFYTCDFRFRQLGMDDRYIYEIHRTSDLLDETFYISCLRSKVGSKWGVAGDVVRNVSSLPHTYDWNLDGTWTYRDGKNDYTLTVKDVRLDPATENSELQEFYMTISYQLTGDGEPLASTENRQVSIRVYTDNVSRNDFNDWYISGDQGGHSVWLYPMGGESTKSGPGIGFKVNGYWLTR